MNLTNPERVTETLSKQPCQQVAFYQYNSMLRVVLPQLLHPHVDAYLKSRSEVFVLAQTPFE